MRLLLRFLATLALGIVLGVIFFIGWVMLILRTDIMATERTYLVDPSPRDSSTDCMQFDLLRAGTERSWARRGTVNWSGRKREAALNN